MAEAKGGPTAIVPASAGLPLDLDDGDVRRSTASRAPRFISASRFSPSGSWRWPPGLRPSTPCSGSSARPSGCLILFAYTWVLMHHMLGGVRHLVWDFGYGMEPGERMNMARFTLIGSIALTLAIWASPSSCSRGDRTMADNRADTRVSMRTPLARVQGLGASGHGVEHWWLHRVTAVSNVPADHRLRDHRGGARGLAPTQEAIAIISHPLVAIVLILAVISVTNHMRLGMQIDHRGLRARQGLQDRRHHRQQFLRGDHRGRLPLRDPQGQPRPDPGLRSFSHGSRNEWRRRERQGLHDRRSHLRRGGRGRGRRGPSRHGRLLAGRPSHRLHHQGVPDALAHGGGAGRHLGLARQYGTGRLALAHVRHREGVGLAGRPGLHRISRAATRPPRSTSSSIGAFRSRAPTRARSTSARSAA